MRRLGRLCLSQLVDQYCNFGEWKNLLIGGGLGQFIDKVFEYDPIADLGEKSSMSMADPRCGISGFGGKIWAIGGKVVGALLMCGGLRSNQ